MKVIKQNITRNQLVSQKDAKKDECLGNGQSITQAIIMGGKGCCGGAYVERAIKS